MKHTHRHTQKNLSLVRATVTWCRYYLGHVSLFHVFWPKVGRTSPIGYISYNLYGTATFCTFRRSDALCYLTAGMFETRPIG